MRLLSIGVALALLLAGCAGPERKPPEKSDQRATVTFFDRLLRIHPVKRGQPSLLFPIAKGPLASCNYLVITGGVPPHKHADHDETLVIVQGQGIFFVEAPGGSVVSHEVTAGTIIHIPRGLGHAYRHLGAGGAASLAINVYSPRMDKPDRLPVKWPEKSQKAAAKKTPPRRPGLPIPPRRG